MEQNVQSITNDIVGRVLSKDYTIVTLNDDRKVNLVRMTGENYINGFNDEELSFDDIDEFEQFVHEKISPITTNIFSKNKYEYLQEQSFKEIQKNICVKDIEKSDAHLIVYFDYLNDAYFSEEILLDNNKRESYRIFQILSKDVEEFSEKLTYDDDFYPALLDLLKKKSSIA